MTPDPAPPDHTYTPFDMSCDKCESLPKCWLGLRIAHAIFGLCRQGRKRRTIQKSAIGDVVARCYENNHPERG